MKIVSIVGARPQFVKAAVLRRKFSENNIQEVLVHTGQHYDDIMSQVFFDEMQIRKPEYNLQLKKRTHGGMTAEILDKFEAILLKEKPDWCLVYGDTNSTLAGALAASKLHIPICHVEAGLRSFNKIMPEEINRVLTDHVSRLLLCPTHQAMQNLKDENISTAAYHVGDIMFDAVKYFNNNIKSTPLTDTILNKNDKKIACMTLHRQENVNDYDKLSGLVSYVKTLLDEYHIVFPAHPNTANKIRDFEINIDGIDMIEPQAYFTMQALLSNSDLVLTDSGGVQKEAYFHGVRCVTLREETEWIETVSHGWNRLWHTPNYEREVTKIDEYGTGKSADKILSLLQE